MNGDAPDLTGRRCDAILCVEYWHAGQLVEPANVAYLCFDGAWYRLYFDYGIVFWRPDDGGPQGYDAPELDASFPVVNVAAPRGLIGVRLSRYEMGPIEGGAHVTFCFDGGHRLEFRSVNDTASYRDA